MNKILINISILNQVFLIFALSIGCNSGLCVVDNSDFNRKYKQWNKFLVESKLIDSVSIIQLDTLFFRLNRDSNFVSPDFGKYEVFMTQMPSISGDVINCVDSKGDTKLSAWVRNLPNDIGSEKGISDSPIHLNDITISQLFSILSFSLVINKDEGRLEDHKN